MHQQDDGHRADLVTYDEYGPLDDGFLDFFGVRIDEVPTLPDAAFATFYFGNTGVNLGITVDGTSRVYVCAIRDDSAGQALAKCLAAFYAPAVACFATDTVH